MLETMKKGIATPIVLIALLVTFSSLIAATSYMALGALKGTAVERATYQAFLVAESALDAFPVLAKVKGCGGEVPSNYTITLREGTSLTAQYSYTNLSQTTLPSQGTITVQAKASYGGATATVEKTFALGCGILGAVPAALTSRPRVEVRGNAQVIGENFDNSTGLIPRNFPSGYLTRASITADLEILSALNNGTFELDVEDASLIPLHGYIQIVTSGIPKTYRVESKRGNTLTLKPLFEPTYSDTIVPLAPVGAVEYGVKSLSGTTLALSTTRGLLVGQKIRVKEQEATITSIDEGNNIITVTWKSSAPTWTEGDEGIPLIPQVVGAASHLGIDTDGSANVQNGALPNSNLVPSDRDELFKRVFGMTKEEFLRLYPPISGSSFNGTLSNWELKAVNGPLNLTGNNRICGEGLLVVFGELTINGSCSGGFKGLIYVAGDYDQQGNASISGAVVVEGSANIECNADDCWTNIAGTQTKGQEGKIQFDPVALYRLRMASAGRLSVAPIAGTWRRL